MEPTAFRLVGLLRSPEYHQARTCLQTLYGEHPLKVCAPECQPLMEFQWTHWLAELKKEEGGEVWGFQEPVAVFMAGKLLGGVSLLLTWAAEHCGYHDKISLLEYEAMAKNEYNQHISNPQFDYVFLDMSIECDEIGRLVLELNQQLCPRTSDNFLCLCTGQTISELKRARYVAAMERARNATKAKNTSETDKNKSDSEAEQIGGGEDSSSVEKSMAGKSQGATHEEHVDPANTQNLEEITKTSTLGEAREKTDQMHTIQSEKRGNEADGEARSSQKQLHANREKGGRSGEDATDISGTVQDVISEGDDRAQADGKEGSATESKETKEDGGTKVTGSQESGAKSKETENRPAKSGAGEGESEGKETGEGVTKVSTTEDAHSNKAEENGAKAKPKRENGTDGNNTEESVAKETAVEMTQKEEGSAETTGTGEGKNNTKINEARDGGIENKEDKVEGNGAEKNDKNAGEAETKSDEAHSDGNRTEENQTDNNKTKDRKTGDSTTENSGKQERINNGGENKEAGNGDSTRNNIGEEKGSESEVGEKASKAEEIEFTAESKLESGETKEKNGENSTAEGEGKTAVNSGGESKDAEGAKGKETEKDKDRSKSEENELISKQQSIPSEIKENEVSGIPTSEDTEEKKTSKTKATKQVGNRVSWFDEEGKDQETGSGEAVELGGLEEETSREEIRGSYLNSIIHRVVPGGWIQGGDIRGGNGDHGMSIYGKTFADECFAIKHSPPGILGMANHGRNTNNSQFYITLAPASWMDKHYVAFGRVVEGSDVLQRLAAVETRNERPKKTCQIYKCGQLHRLA